MNAVATVNRWPVRSCAWHGDSAMKDRVLSIARKHRELRTEVVGFVSSRDCPTALSIVLREMGAPANDRLLDHWRTNQVWALSREASYLGVPVWFISALNDASDSFQSRYNPQPEAGWDAVINLLEALPVGADIGPVQAVLSVRLIRENLIPGVKMAEQFRGDAHLKELEALEVCARILEGEDFPETVVEETTASLLLEAHRRYARGDISRTVWELARAGSMLLVRLDENDFDEKVRIVHMDAATAANADQGPHERLGRRQRQAWLAELLADELRNLDSNSF